MNLPKAPIAHEGFFASQFFAVSDQEKGDKGAFFLTEPPNIHSWEWRCYMRDPDGYLIEVGQYTEIAIDWFKNLPNA